MRISIDLCMPEPGAPTSSEKLLPIPVEDRVRDALEMVDSGHDSGVEWHLISRFYRELCAMSKKSPRVQNLIRMIEPVLSKYGYHGVDAEERK